MNMIEKIKERNIVFGVVGLGYVGLPLAIQSSRNGFKTIGVDVQEDKVKLINAGKNYIKDVDEQELKKLVAEEKLSATTAFEAIKDMDVIAVCVPTPLDAYQQPDISYVKESVIKIAQYMKKGTVVILESTTYPGTTEELLKPLLEKGSQLICGTDFYLGFSPERVDPGNQKFSTSNTPKVVGALGEEALTIICQFYEEIIDAEIFKVSSPASAEMVKLLENTYRNINIGLINELTMLCERMGINIWEVVDAAKTKPYGFQAFYPGPGLGGHCIPLDPYYLSWKAREFKFHTSMIETSMTVNDKMPEYIIERCYKTLNKRKKSLNGSTILVLGVAYKNDIDDYRESPALKIIENLKNEAANVEYYDPYISEYFYHGEKNIGLANISEANLKKYDLVVIATAHKVFDYQMIQEHSDIILDTRNAMETVTNRSNIVLL